MKKFIRLNPEIAHIYGRNIDNRADEHLSTGEGNFDFKFISGLIKKSNTEKLTFDVPKKNGLANDLKSMESFRLLVQPKTL